MKKLIHQVFKFGIVGVIATLVDMLFIYIFTDFLHFIPVISNIFSFLISVAVNYPLSMRFVFKSKEGINKRNEIIIFFILSALGFGINELLMYLGTEVWDFYYMLVKVFAVCVSLVFNFITKKYFLEGKLFPEEDVNDEDNNSDQNS